MSSEKEKLLPLSGLDKQDNEAALLDTFTLSCTLFSRTDWVKKSLQAQNSAIIGS